MPASASSVSYNTSQFTNTHPTVQNVVATANFQVRLILANIVLHARNAEYCPKRFSAVIIRIREPKATGLIFATGRLVVTGAKSEDLARLAARKFARIIQKIGYQVKFAEFKIQNVVATYAFGSSIRLEGLARKHRQFAHYEPEIFPGLVYRMAQEGVILIFTTGRIVITGTKSREAMSQVFDNIYPVLVEFEKHEGPEDEDSTAITLSRE